MSKALLMASELSEFGFVMSPDSELIAELRRLAAVEKQLAEARNALLSINQYGSDTLSGRVDGPDDRKWQRDAVREMTGLAYAAIKAKEQP